MAMIDIGDYFHRYHMWYAGLSQSRRDDLISMMLCYTLLVVMIYVFATIIVRGFCAKRRIEYGWGMAGVSILISLLFPVTAAIIALRGVMLLLTHIFKSLTSIRIKDGPPNWM